MPPFSGVDFYETDSLFSEEERQIRDQVRAWVEERYLPLVERAYEGTHNIHTLVLGQAITGIAAFR
jgi:alkylation response protein AidB-like acyl-CoA dehydrogenase